MHIVFSGVDGAGKSTQIHLLMEMLQKQGKVPIYLWTRGGYTPRFNMLKNVLRFVTGGRAIPDSGHSKRREENLGRPGIRKLWLTLAIAELWWIYGVQIRWWLLHGKIVVCDRYVDDTLLDFRHNFPQETVSKWWLWRGLCAIAAKADATFLLLVPVEESITRSLQKDEPFPDSPETLRWRLAEYEVLTTQRSWQVFDGRQPIDKIAEAIKESIAKPSDQQYVVAA